jgi:hypothetical protein
MGLLILIGLIKIRESYGDPVSVIVPLPVCDECRQHLGESTVMLDALRRIPEYESLLDYYPDAKITRFI